MIFRKNISIMNYFHILTVLSIFISKSLSETVDRDSTGLFDIEGRVEVVSTSSKDWISNTQVLVDGGLFVAHIRNDGGFVVNGVPTGTYVVEVLNADYIFESFRVDINAKGKKRVRRVNYLQPSVLKTVHYPLEFRERRKSNYFQKREQLKMTDFLFNPMVLTMVLPLVLIMVLPKMMNAADPDAQKEMQAQMKSFNSKSAMPDMSEMITGLFGGGGSGKSASKKSNKGR